jgi:hypothetical protein
LTPVPARERLDQQMAWTLTLLASLAALGALIAVAPVSAKPTPSEVTLRVSDDGTGWEGRVISDKRKCERNRDVRLTDGERGGIRRDDTTDRRGRFELEGVGGPVPPGEYVVKAFRKPGCPVAKSDPLRV